MIAQGDFLVKDTNLNEMSDPHPHREKFITKSRLHDWQKAEVRKANDKTTKCEELNFWHTLSDAKDAANSHAYRTQPSLNHETPFCRTA
jgi:predicted nucleotidyltransferase component of viral defense system